MAFAERFEAAMEEAGESALQAILDGGFVFDIEVNGIKCGVNRMKDLILGNGILMTEVFVYPQNGEKKRRMQGVVMTIHSEVENPEEKEMTYVSSSLAGFHRPMLPEIYYSHVASRGGKLIAEEGYDTFLHHDVMICTPEKEMVTLEGFDFEANKLFMLGLYGGDYKIGIRDKIR